MFHRGILAAAVCASALLLPSPSHAVDGDAPASAQARPTVLLDRLDFPALLGAKGYRRHLARTLKREVRRVDWGASSDSTIEYRFAVRKLQVTRKGKVLSVSVTAEGMLPGGKTAKSTLTFGGDPGHHSQLIRRVLAIVARGVVARLAEMERVRRGRLPSAT